MKEQIFKCDKCGKTIMKIINVLFLLLILQCAAHKNGLQYFYADKNQSIPEIRNMIILFIYLSIY